MKRFGVVFWKEGNVRDLGGFNRGGLRQVAAWFVVCLLAFLVGLVCATVSLPDALVCGMM